VSSIGIVLGVNLINVLFTLGFGPKDSAEILKSLLVSAYKAVLRERKLLFGSLLQYFSATSFWIIKKLGQLKNSEVIIFLIIFLLTLYGRDPKNVIFSFLKGFRSEKSREKQNLLLVRI